MSKSVFTKGCSSKRNGTIDCLRFIGLSLIILAHVIPSARRGASIDMDYQAALFNLRCFDVPMMLFISGLAYSYRKIDFSVTFFVRRLLRLIVPVYIFLTGYFLITTTLKYAAGIDFGYSVRQMVSSYLLMGGIGYVWIIRVFLLIAFLTPLLKTAERRVHNDILLWLILVGVTALISIGVHNGWGMNNRFVNKCVYYAIGYSISFIAGLRVMRMDKKRFIRFFVLVSIVMVALCCAQTYGGGNILAFQTQKYPPQYYYIFYGLFMSLVCYAICSYTHIGDTMPSICRFIGMNTIWIYLYHIPIVHITVWLPMPWWIRYIVVYVIAVVISYIQISIVNKLQSRHNKAIYKYFKG